MSKQAQVKIPGYRIKRVRGEGAMATVYEAEHKGLVKPVALKVLHDFVAGDADYLQRFFREARAAARLNHRNVVRAYEAGEHEGLYYFAMEYVEGEDLGERLAREVTLPEEEAIRIGIEVCAALTAAEEHGMVHRDIKPENVLLGPQGEVKLADLGLAKVQGDGHLTAEGYTLGTVAFFSPEQCRGSSSLDIRSDLYAVGALIYNLVSGELPFGRGDNAPLTMQRIIEEEAPPIAASAPTLEAIDTLMAKDKDDRPDSATDARELLEATLAQLRGEAPAVPRPLSASSSSGRNLLGGRKKRRRRRRVASVSSRSDSGLPLGIVAVFVAVGILLGLLLAFGSSGAQAPSDRGADRARKAGVR